MLSPVGNSVEQSWQAVQAGQSGISNIEHFDTEKFSVKFAGMVKDFNVEDYMPRKEARKMDVFIQYGVAAAEQAFKDSGLKVTDENAERIGVAIGSGIGGITTIETNVRNFDKSGPRKISPFFVPASIINMISGHVSINKGLKGPNIAVTTACTTGTHSIGLAARMIQYGDADVMFAGGAEKASSEISLGGFASARALSTRNDSPETASRPWDKDRDGFVLGDGSGVLVLEEYEHAKARGAKIYAELVGFGMSGDAYHMTAPPESGAGAAQSMKNAIKDAQINAVDIQYINAHGTSTPTGDIAETQAVKGIWGEAADKVMMSSTKSMTGHLLGAAGAIEAIFSVLALRDQVAPPTINLENPSEGCDLDYVTDGKARPANIEYALSNSFGFGGTNGTLIFKRI
jgi:3-oxoacyl-[acyl-carrier-protein] synthase II